MSTGTSVSTCPRHWGGGWAIKTIPRSWGQWAWMDSCWGEGGGLESGFPLRFLQLRAAGQLRPGHRNHSSVLLNCTLQCIQAHIQLEPALGPVLQPMFGFHVPSVLRCSLGTPGPDLCALKPPEALASWTWASAGHWSVLSSLRWGCWALLEALPSVGDMWATVPAPSSSNVQTILSSLCGPALPPPHPTPVWPRGLE